MNTDNGIILNRHDYARISGLLENLEKHNKLTKPHYLQFASELQNARIADGTGFPEYAVTMYSKVKFSYTGKDEVHSAVPVFPADVQDSPDNISILSPLGLALIGRQCGTESEYSAPGGIYRIRIESVRQPAILRTI